MFPIKGFFPPNMNWQKPVNPGPNQPFQPWQSNMPSPNQGFGVKPPFSNMAWMPPMNMPWQPVPWMPKQPMPMPPMDMKPMPGKPDDKKPDAPSGPELSGKGSIRGNSFRTADGERWEPNVQAGRTYNLLSDGGVGVNGTYASKGGETILDKIGMKVGGSTITLSSDGTFQIDGKAFRKGKNDLDGAVTLKNGTYTITTDEGYTFKLKASESGGITADIEAKDVGADGIKPEGLWGVAFDGEKQTASDLKKDIKPRSYEIKDALTFDYEDNNALSDTATLGDEDRNERLWHSENPQSNGEKYHHWVAAGHYGKNTFNSHGGGGNEDDRYWDMKSLKDNRTYNVFSDEGIQVNGKFKSGELMELGAVINGSEIHVIRDGTGIKVKIDGEEVKSYDSDGIKLENGKLTFTSDDGSEKWDFEVRANNSGLAFYGRSNDVGKNSTRSTGLLGDAIDTNPEADNGNDVDGAGYLRDEDGALSKAGQNMRKALELYEVDDLFDTSSGRSVYER